MPSVKLTIPHSLDQAEALRRIQSLLTETKGQFADRISNIQEVWVNNIGTFSFSVAGFKISGTMTVETREVRIHGDLPFLAGMFRNQIESVIQVKAKEILV